MFNMDIKIRNLEIDRLHKPFPPFNPWNAAMTAGLVDRDATGLGGRVKQAQYARA